MKIILKIILRIILAIPLALPVTIILVHWPLWFAVIGGGLCVLALCVMAVQIATSAPRYEPTAHDVAATVDGVPVREVTVLR